MNTLAKQETTALVTNGSIPGLEQVDQDDIIMPRIKASGKRGLFEDKLSGSATQTLNCILLTRLKTRAKFRPDNSLECGSKDRITGDTYGLCAECQYANAFEQDEQGKDKPSCPQSYTFLLLKGESSVPYKMILSARSAIGPAHNYVSKFLVSKKPLFSVETELSFLEKTAEIGGKKITYFALVFNAGKETDPKNQEIYHKILKDFSSKIELDPEMETEKAEDFSFKEV